MKKQNHFTKASRDLCPCRVNYKCTEHCPRSNFKLYKNSKNSITSETSETSNYNFLNLSGSFKCDYFDSSNGLGLILKRFRNSDSLKKYLFCGFRSRTYFQSKSCCGNSGLIDIKSLIKLLNSKNIDKNIFRYLGNEEQTELTLQLAQEFFDFRIIRVGSFIKTSINKNSNIVLILKDNNKVSILKFKNNLLFEKTNKLRLPYFTERFLTLKTNIIVSGKYEFIAYGIEQGYPESRSFIEFLYYNKNNKKKIMKIDSIRNFLQLSNDEQSLIFCNKSDILQIASTRKFIIIKEIKCLIINPLFELLGNDMVYCCSRYCEKILRIYNIKENSLGDNKITLRYGKTTCIKVNNTYFAAAFKYDKIVVYFRSNFKEFFKLKYIFKNIKKLEFISDSSKLVSVESNLNIIIWCLSTRNLLKKIHLPLRCRFLQVLNDECILGFKKYMIAIKLEDDLIDQTIDDHAHHISSFTLSKSCIYVATGGYDKNIVVLNTKTKKYIFKVNAHDQCIQSLQFSNYDQILLSNGYDYYIKIWNAQSMEILKKIDYCGSESLIDDNFYFFMSSPGCINCEPSKYDDTEIHSFIIDYWGWDSNLCKACYLSKQASTRKNFIYFDHKKMIPVITNSSKYIIVSDSTYFCVLKLGLI